MVWPVTRVCSLWERQHSPSAGQPGPGLILVQVRTALLGRGLKWLHCGYVLFGSAATHPVTLQL